MVKEEKEIKTNKVWWVVLGVTLALIIILTIALPTKQLTCSREIIKTETESEPYQEIEYYYELEPYTDTECNSISMVYKASFSKNERSCIQEECVSYNQVCAEKNFWGNCIRYTDGTCANNKCTKYIINCGVKIENKEKQTLSAPLRLSSYNYDKKQENPVDTRNIDIAPLDTREYFWDFTALPTESVGCLYTLTQDPIMETCNNIIKYHNMQKSRQVTKYRNVEKTRQIQEDYKKEVNWLLGSC